MTLIGSRIGNYLLELVVVFVGVFLAFAVENLREDLNERAIEQEYLRGFGYDLEADRAMLAAGIEDRRSQLRNAETVLEFFDGRVIEPQVFFEAYWAAIYERHTVPNRNTLTEVLNSGNLRLIRDETLRKRLLKLYASYERIAINEAHMARDFGAYLYDTTFALVPVDVSGPWPDTPAQRSHVGTLLGELAVENGIRLIVINLTVGGLLDQLTEAATQVDQLLVELEVGTSRFMGSDRNG